MEICKCASIQHIKCVAHGALTQHCKNKNLKLMKAYCRKTYYISFIRNVLSFDLNEFSDDAHLI